jgi:hypothetical protein
MSTAVLYFLTGYIRRPEVGDTLRATGALHWEGQETVYDESGYPPGHRDF